MTWRTTARLMRLPAESRTKVPVGLLLSVGFRPNVWLWTLSSPYWPENVRNLFKDQTFPVNLKGFTAGSLVCRLIVSLNIFAKSGEKYSPSEGLQCGMGPHSHSFAYSHTSTKQ